MNTDEVEGFFILNEKSNDLQLFVCKKKCKIKPLENQNHSQLEES